MNTMTVLTICISKTGNKYTYTFGKDLVNYNGIRGEELSIIIYFEYHLFSISASNWLRTAIVSTVYNDHWDHGQTNGSAVK